MGKNGMIVLITGVHYIGGRDPPRAGGQEERRLGEATAPGAAPP
jgi:hypothetical protein